MKFYFGVVFFCIQKVSSQTLSLLDYALKYQRLFSSSVSVGIIPTNKRKHFNMALRIVRHNSPAAKLMKYGYFCTNLCVKVN